MKLKRWKTIYRKCIWTLLFVSVYFYVHTYILPSLPDHTVFGKLAEVLKFPPLKVVHRGLSSKARETLSWLSTDSHNKQYVFNENITMSFIHRQTCLQDPGCTPPWTWQPGSGCSLCDGQTRPPSLETWATASGLSRLPGCVPTHAQTLPPSASALGDRNPAPSGH